jgi:hypothetical protein
MDPFKDLSLSSPVRAHQKGIKFFKDVHSYFEEWRKELSQNQRG